jgi:hypothetical protein
MANQNQGNPGANNAGDNKDKDKDKNKDKEKNEKKKDFVVVRFKKSYTPYLKGEKAGVSKEEAKKLMEKGVCEKA